MEYSHSTIKVNRQPINFSPDSRRVVTRFFYPNDKERIIRIFDRINLLSDDDANKYLSQVINTEHNKNFREFINTLRIKEAEKLLKETSLKIEAVAYETGFNTISTFNIAFKKETGITPSEYRKKNQ